MREGWHVDDYLILFDESEVVAATDCYELLRFLPGFKILGLRSWDDFIVRDASGQTYSIPTLPLDTRHLLPLSLPDLGTTLDTDARFSGKIKWYLKPIVFGGETSVGETLSGSATKNTHIW